MKYLKELDIKIEDTPYGWCKGDTRELTWSQERQEYGFDQRETWALDYTFYLWLYQRLKMYNEVNIIDTSFYTFEYNGQKFTQQECIDKMIEGCKIFITKEHTEMTVEEQDKIKDVTRIWALCIDKMWW